jgi:hypothetical protein
MTQTHQPMMIIPSNPAALVSIMRNDTHITGSIRPQFSFNYQALQFGQSVHVYVNDGVEYQMTDAQKEEVLNFLNNLEVSEEKSRQYAESLANLKYLEATDWYVTRMIESGVPVPEDILAARAAARAKIVRS